jgi:thiol-disulfide isomerase/thioredoxin
MKGFKPLLAFLLTLCLAATARAASDATDLLEPYRGSVTYVDFWASWCAPCAESFPWLNTMQARYAQQGLRVVGVGVDTTAAKGDRFLKAHPAQFSLLRDPEGKLAEHFNAEGMPYSVLLDADGRVIHRHTGFRADETGEYEQAIQAALAAQGKNK